MIDYLALLIFLSCVFAFLLIASEDFSR